MSHLFISVIKNFKLGRMYNNSRVDDDNIVQRYGVTSAEKCFEVCQNFDETLSIDYNYVIGNGRVCNCNWSSQSTDTANITEYADFVYYEFICIF